MQTTLVQTDQKIPLAFLKRNREIVRDTGPPNSWVFTSTINVEELIHSDKKAVDFSLPKVSNELIFSQILETIKTGGQEIYLEFVRALIGMSISTNGAYMGWFSQLLRITVKAASVHSQKFRINLIEGESISVSFLLGSNHLFIDYNEDGTTGLAIKGGAEPLLYQFDTVDELNAILNDYID